MKTTISATRPDGIKMHWTGDGWSPSVDDAKDYKCTQSAWQSAKWDMPFRGLTRLGWEVQVLTVAGPCYV